MFLKFLLCGVTIALVVSAEESEDLEGNCGDTFNKTTGNFSTPDIDPGKNKNCTWIIQAGNESNPSVTLQFTGIDFLSGNDSLDVYANENETLPIATFANAKVPGPVIVISFDSVTKIVFRRGSGNMTGKFSASFNTVNCTQTLMAMQGVINSPIYQNGTGNVSCTYNVNMTGNKDVVLLSTKDFYLPNGTLDVTFQKTTTTLKGVGNQNDVFGDAGTQSFSLKLTLNNDPKPQKFSALFTTVNKDCSGQLNALDGDTTMTFGPNQFPVKCHVQLVAKTNKTVYASAGSKAAQRVHLYDGGSINAPVIGDFSAGSWYSSSGQTMTLIAYGDSSNSPFNFTFRQVDRAFYSLTIGEIQSLQLKTDKRVQFLTDTNSKLNIEFNTNTTSLSGNATVILQDGGDQTFGTQIFSFSADTPLFPVLSPSNRLIVSVQGVSGGNVVDINVTAVRLGNSRVYTDNNAEINWEVLAETKCIMGIINSSNTASTDIITFSLSSLTLCGKSTLSVYKGFKKSAQLLATYTPASAPILNIRFPAAEGAKFEWADPQKTCSGAQPILMANYWTQSEGTACGNYSEATNGTITSPGYPDTYPLNTHCNYPLKDQANSSLYVTLTSIQLDPAHNLTLNRNGTPIRYFRNSSETFHPLTVDAIVPSENLSLDFDARTVNGSDSQKPNAGYNLSFRFLTCGGVMKAKNATITSPVNVTQSTECIWIIQLQKDGPDKSVNIIHASISLTGITNSSRDVLEVRDGGSARDILVKKENYTDFLTRTNYLWIRYFVDVSNKTNSVEADMPFAFSLNYTEKTCNQSSLCANGLCMHENWQCNDVNDCGDWSDEKNCNGSHPFPPPTTAKPHPEPQGGSKGVKAYWIAICLILGIILGGMIVYFIPRCYRRIKYPNYSHLRDSLSPSEA